LFVWWLVVGADLFRDKSIIGWLLVCHERKVMLARG
jgi:hypothetical protein